MRQDIKARKLLSSLVSNKLQGHIGKVNFNSPYPLARRRLLELVLIVICLFGIVGIVLVLYCWY